ncbi:MAG: AMP-binding protein, partial [Nitrospinota bacterium]
METLCQLLEEAAARFPAGAALQGDTAEGGRVAYTRPQLRERAAALARALVEAGVGPGEPVALLSPNRPEWAIGYFGAVLAGAVLVPLDVNLKEGELLNVLQRSGARALLTDATERGRGAGLLAKLPGAEGGRPQLWIDEPPAGAPPRAAELPGASRRAGDLALISFSSGTTGVPKGVMLTHGNIVSNVRAVLHPFTCGPGDVFLSVLPLHHMFESTGGLLLPLASGAAVHYLASLNPRVLGETMRREGVSICLMVPALLRLMHKRILGAAYATGGLKGRLFRVLFPISQAAARAGLRIGGLLFPQARRALSPRLRYLVSGGAALDPEVGWDLLALGIEVIQGYGLTETSPITHANRPGRGNRIGTVGPPLPGVEARLEPVPGGAPGEGEVWIKGPNVMQGYFH